MTLIIRSNLYKGSFDKLSPEMVNSSKTDISNVFITVEIVVKTYPIRGSRPTVRNLFTSLARCDRDAIGQTAEDESEEVRFKT